jgi:hypothetical protein
MQVKKEGRDGKKGIVKILNLRYSILNKKMAGYLHRTATTAYPCYLPVLGEFSRSWPYKTCRCKYRNKSY